MPPDRRPDAALARERFTGITKAARDLGVAERTVRRAIETGDVPTYVLAPGGRARIKVADVRAWLERCRRR
jgi:excisionase family DNA binding protein